jgi:uncharacterized protein (TIGR02646 family)
MQKFQRPPIPQCLAERGEQWKQNWLKRKSKNAAAGFYWPKYPNAKGSPANQHLLPLLLHATADHCAYCDKYPLFISDHTIDHFLPKSRFPQDAYNWQNLFPACDNCQSVKKEQYDKALLKPDDADFEYNRYFMVDFTTFELFPNPNAKEYDKLRVVKSIEIFGLNDPAHCTNRRQNHERFSFNTNVHIDDFAYRYMFEY